MLNNEPKQYNFHSILYNKISENHILKSINKIVDFTFISEMLEDSYYEYYGRHTKEPEMMIKLKVPTTPSPCQPSPLSAYAKYAFTSSSSSSSLSIFLITLLALLWFVM